MPLLYLVWLQAILALWVHRNNRRRKERQMGPRVLVPPAAFVDLVNGHGAEVVCRPPRRWMPGQYVARVGDYYYFCNSKADLAQQFSDRVTQRPCLGIWL